MQPASDPLGFYLDLYDKYELNGTKQVPPVPAEVRHLSLRRQYGDPYRADVTESQPPKPADKPASADGSYLSDFGPAAIAGRFVSDAPLLRQGAAGALSGVATAASREVLNKYLKKAGITGAPRDVLSESGAYAAGAATEVATLGAPEFIPEAAAVGALGGAAVSVARRFDTDVVEKVKKGVAEVEGLFTGS